jgi:hypothetical protein
METGGAHDQAVRLEGVFGWRSPWGRGLHSCPLRSRGVTECPVLQVAGP